MTYNDPTTETRYKLAGPWPGWCQWIKCSPPPSQVNFKNIKDRCADQPAKERVTYRFNVLQLSTICGWEKLIFQKCFQKLED
jgi:hypothetical protein